MVEPAESRVVEEFPRRLGPAGPTHLVRAPGRVNLIGEHTDYNGLPVFPMALQREVRIAFRARDDARARLANLDPRFQPLEFDVSHEIPPGPAGDWGNYARAAAQALSRRSGIRRGFDALVEGDIPPAAGLSSSSALLVACALAFLAANDVDLEEIEVMELCARAERYVGTKSGGMDQAICLGARAGHAVVIDFDPLRLRPTPVPSDWRFVVANTFVEAKKSGAAQAAYNARVDECLEAWSALAPAFAAADRAGGPATLRDLLARVPAGRILEVAERALRPALFHRLRHVVTEAVRVEAARAAMLEGDLEAFGRAMDVSHESLRTDYEASHPALDELVRVARAHGALGARLTGAGFGGCAVALCRANGLERLVAGIEKDFHGTRSSTRVGPSDGPPLFVAEASDGASVVAL